MRALSENICAIASLEKNGRSVVCVRSQAMDRSNVEEDGFVLALKEDVETINRSVGAAFRDQRGPALLRHHGEDRVRGIGDRLIAEIEARRQSLQDAARKDRDSDMGCLYGAG